MATIAPSSSLQLDEAHGEVHFAVSGFWNVESMRTLLDELNETSLPLVKARKPIRALGDMTEFVPQDRATGDAIRDHLLGAQKFGLERVAIITQSALVKLQYRRLSQGVEVEFFENRADAVSWLRR